MKTVKNLKKKKKQISHVCHAKKEMFLQHDDATPCTSVATSVAIESTKFEVVPHPPNSLDLAPSDFHCLHLSRHISKEFLHLW